MDYDKHSKHTNPIMRKIEQQMTEAVQNDRRWSSGNTTVIPGWEGTVDVYLHGNRIATIGEDWMQLWDGGYQSKTTKSRSQCSPICFQASTEKGCLLRILRGKLQQDGGPVPFFDGMQSCLRGHTPPPNLLQYQRTQPTP